MQTPASNPNPSAQPVRIFESYNDFLNAPPLVASDLAERIYMMRFFARFRENDWVEFRCIANRKIKRFWFHPSRIPAMTTLLQTLNSGGYEVYAGVNPRSCGQSNAAGITSVVSLHADLDGSLPIWPAIPEPSMIVASGAGYHCYWELTEPTTEFARVESLNRGLARAIGADQHCSDISRILRVPGYWSHKRHRQVEIVQATDGRYLLNDFPVSLWSSWNDTDVTGASAPKNAQYKIDSSPSVPEPSPDLLSRLAVARKRDSALRRAYCGEVGDGSSDARYATVTRLASAGFTENEIRSIIVHRRWWNRKSRSVCPVEKVQRDTDRLINILCSFSAEPCHEAEVM